MNIAHLDQLEAATADARRRLRWIAEHTTKSTTVTDRPGSVIRAIAARFRATLDAPQQCGHITGPQPCLAYAWRPGLPTCGDCPATTSDVVIGSEAQLCDGCGSSSQPLTGGATLIGPIGLVFALCGHCVDTERESAERQPNASDAGDPANP